ncbi:MAG: hypothetical protein AB7V56_02725 [Candidatus Nitrosocosmicus sp.]|jgi:hypothetical protein|uniref:hypothetical protein n=1 Tax=Candidatus Nitrosocosmicus agrestis TaxID=2563600 RepID=UPI00122E98DA|nr:hypothetical protein [Candidatus Nitrosocosmicus sp. SS]KAA2279087.1 hypothetical protein F1Z66_14180 [Candidatus Nitrosocosmicus sp. SS]KAF0867684.1 hypothetical protein E5N71_13915 [Candidatus Nitrosocosmicus sp. SS]MDR4489897.1 hypothetical protein [Candidatus Nitrosocosmicus sp.]HET6588839.1 hypothetical protein [Candidatus Nitrosocosmicus sp.]
MDNTSHSSEKEKGILFEDCSEDKLKNGILTLTNKKLAFEKTKGRIATLSKELLGEKLEFEFREISTARSEGRIIKKLVIEMTDSDIVYKFGVMNPNRWAKEINLQKEINMKNNM